MIDAIIFHLLDLDFNVKMTHGFCFFCSIIKLGSLISHTEWSNISERNSILKRNLKKGPELTL